MEKSRLLGAVCACVLAVFATTTNAALIVPAGLSAGDEYHVIFVTSTQRNGLSTDIADYDAHVQAAADAAGIGSSISLDWYAVGSTASIDAKDHLSPLFSNTTNVPIYNQFGELISSSFDGLWDGSIDNAVRYTENADQIGMTLDIYTGTDEFGEGFYDTFNAVYRRLGDASMSKGGRTDTSTNWIRRYIETGPTELNSFYGLSDTITVPTPVPAAVWLFGSGLLGLIGMARRKKA